MSRHGGWALCLVVLVCGPVAAQGASFNITTRERAACTADALRFCAYTYPSEGRLLTCMKANQPYLSARCRPVFEAGMRRRGLL